MVAAIAAYPLGEHRRTTLSHHDYPYSWVDQAGVVWRVNAAVDGPRPVAESVLARQLMAVAQRLNQIAPVVSAAEQVVPPSDVAPEARAMQPMLGEALRTGWPPGPLGMQPAMVEALIRQIVTNTDLTDAPFPNQRGVSPQRLIKKGGLALRYATPFVQWLVAAQVLEPQSANGVYPVSADMLDVERIRTALWATVGVHRLGDSDGGH